MRDLNEYADMIEELVGAWYAQAAMPDDTMETVTIPKAHAMAKELRAQAAKDRNRVGSCPCECNSGGFCGGCGHAGCGGRNR